MSSFFRISNGFHDARFEKSRNKSRVRTFVNLSFAPPVKGVSYAPFYAFVGNRFLITVFN